MATSSAADRRGLVLGGGGITGIAWELGLVTGLAEAGVDLRAADLVVGTSAGSVVGAQLTSDADLEHLYQRQLEPPSKEKAAAIDRRVTFGFAVALLRTRGDLPAFGRRLGALSLKAAAAGRLPTLEARYAAIRTRLPSPDWPAADLRVTVVNAHTGDFRVLTAADGVPLERAVAASCAVPGVYPAVPLDGGSYVDGGVRSAANVDVASGCARVLCLAPLARSIPWLPSVQGQLDALGVPTLLITPDAAAMVAIGKNVLDPAARPGSARAGRAQAAAAAAELRSFWG